MLQLRRGGPLVIVAFAAACGPKTQSAPGPVPKPVPRPAPVVQPPPKRPIAYELPAFPVRTGLQRRCARPAPKLKPTVRRKLKAKSYDFDTVTVHPLPGGPRVGHQPPSSYQRTHLIIREAFVGQAEYFRSCYRWWRFGRAKPNPGGKTVDVELDVGPLGQVTARSVVVRRGLGNYHKAFERCVSDGINAMRVAERASHTTRVKTAIEFVESGLGRPRVRPKRPTARAKQLPATACVLLPRPVPVRRLDIDVAARFSDWDATRAARRRKTGATRRPQIRIARACLARGADMTARRIRTAVLSNLGEYRDCYRKQLGRKPGQRVTVLTRFSVLTTGFVTNVKATGGSPELNRCVARAMGQVRFPFAYGYVTHVRFPLAFEPTPAGVVAPATPAQLAAKIRASGGGSAECRGRVGVLEAMMRAAPWLDDARVMWAAQDVARYAGKHQGTTDQGIKRCLSRAAGLLSRVAFAPYKPPRDGAQLPRRFSWWQLGLTEVEAKLTALHQAWPGHPRDVLFQLVRASIRAVLAEYTDAERLAVEALTNKLSKRQVRRLLRDIAYARRASGRTGKGKFPRGCGSLF